MTTTTIRFSLTLLVLTVASVGCTPLTKDSSMKNKITKEPDASFLKRVKNDPFPSAGQAPKTQTAANTQATTTPTNGRTAASAAASRTNNARSLAAQPAGTKPKTTASTGDTSTATVSDSDESTETTTTASRPLQPLRRR